MKTYSLFDELSPEMLAANPNYRGTDRSTPYYVDGLPETAPVNKMWLEQISIAGADSLNAYEDVVEVEKLQDAFAEHGFLFDLVMVLDGDDLEESADYPNLLGFEVSYANDMTLLPQNVGSDVDYPLPTREQARKNGWEATYDEVIKEMEKPRPLLKLMYEYFAPRINAFGLLPSLQDARFFVEVARSIGDAFDNVWDGVYEVKALFLIRGRESYSESQKELSAPYRYALTAARRATASSPVRSATVLNCS